LGSDYAKPLLSQAWMATELRLWVLEPIVRGEMVAVRLCRLPKCVHNPSALAQRLKDHRKAEFLNGERGSACPSLNGSAAPVFSEEFFSALKIFSKRSSN
jgi:hypothetical protein